MSKNIVQYQHGYSLPDLFNNYWTETQYKNALSNVNGQVGLLALLVHQQVFFIEIKKVISMQPLPPSNLCYD